MTLRRRLEPTENRPAVGVRTVDEYDFHVVEMFQQLDPDVRLVRIWWHRPQKRDVNVLENNPTEKL